MPSAATGEVTRLLRAWSAGHPRAQEELLALVYGDLRQRAAGHLRRDRRGHTLQPTALVHEALCAAGGSTPGHLEEPLALLRAGVSSDAADSRGSRPRPRGVETSGRGAAGHARERPRERRAPRLLIS